MGAPYDEVKAANLRKLAAYLKALPKDYTHFDMDVYLDTSKSTVTRPYDRSWPKVINRLDLTSCDAVACAVGHGPSAGIPFNECDYERYVLNPWRVYAYQKFVNTHEEFQWCFGGRWSDVDNTPYGAALRIEWFLEHDLPVTWEDQMFGRLPLCYK